MVKRLLDRKDILKHSRRVRRQRLWSRVILWFGIIVLVLAEVFWLLHWEKMTFNQFVVRGGSPSLMREIQATVTDYLEQDYFGFIPKRSIIFSSQRSLLAKLSAELPEIASIGVADTSNNQLVLEVEERVATYLWCGSGGDECYLLDKNGLAFSKAPDFSGQPFFEFFSQSAVGPIGTLVLVPELFQKAVTLQKSFDSLLPSSALQLRPYRLELASGREWRWFLHSSVPDESEQDTIFLTDAQQPASLISQNLQSILASSEFVAELKDNRRAGRRLQYLDLRFSDKVFYKFQ